MLNRYFIAVVVPEPIGGDILKFKEYFRDQYKSKASLNSPAHITLHMPFERNAESEDELVSLFQKFSIKPFTIELKDFGCFEPRVIFIDVKKNPELEDCERNVRSFARTKLNIFNAQYRDQPFHPHVTLAFRDLRKNQFDEAWGEFKSKTFSASFECTRVSLLKHDGKYWREFL
jgi:2'-5' RNA ligase